MKQSEGRERAGEMSGEPASDGTAGDDGPPTVAEHASCPVGYPDEGQIVEVVVPWSVYSDDDGTLADLEGLPEDDAQILSLAFRTSDGELVRTVVFTIADVEPAVENGLRVEGIPGVDPREVEGSQAMTDRMIMPDTRTARAAVFHLAEMLAWDEASIVANAAHTPGFDYDDHREWMQGLTARDRRMRLLDCVETQARLGRDGNEVSLTPELAERYLEHPDARWRGLGLSDRARRAATHIAQGIDRTPWLCYRTSAYGIEYAMEQAFTSAGVDEVDIPLDEDGFYAPDGEPVSDRYGPAIDEHRVRYHRCEVQYVEGLVLPRDASGPIQHAWLEIDGAVAELTWPWHSPDPAAPDRYDPTAETADPNLVGDAMPGVDCTEAGEGPAVYYGVPVEWPRVLATRNRRQGNSPILMDDEAAQAKVDEARSRSKRQPEQQAQDDIGVGSLRNLMGD
jgi:hypothetical protein